MKPTFDVWVFAGLNLLLLGAFAWFCFGRACT